MNIFIIILIILGVFWLIAIIGYSLAFKPVIIKSRVADGDNGAADQYYYLPQAQIELTVTAVVRVDRSAIDNSIIATEVIEMRLRPEVQIEPDTEQRILVIYEGNTFFNDELKVVTSSSALLENVRSVSEDRISDIVAQISQTPASLKLADVQAFTVKDKKAVVKTVTQIIESSRTFTIGSKKLRQSSITFEWKIPLEGVAMSNVKNIDASFTLNNSKQLSFQDLADTEFDGLLVRPLVSQEWTLDLPGAEAVSFSCLVPDTGVIMRVPVRRSNFVKRQHLPKFKDGLLIENTIIKPSEAEGLVSIPLNILKAIASIPAQLFQFRIARIRWETEFHKALAELARAKDALSAKQDSDAKMLRDSINGLNHRLDRLPASPPPASEPQEGSVTLGKLPPLPFDEGVPGIKSLTTDAIETAALVGLPEPKESHNWAERNSTWNEYENRQMLTCVPASAAHLVASWTSNSNTPTRLLSLEVVINTLRKVAPDNDLSKGCHVLTFLKYWRDKGMNGERINDFKPVTAANSSLLRHAIYWFGGCIVGLQLPVSVKNKTEWIFQESMKAETKEGHAVCTLGYAGNRFTAISFGNIIHMDADFYENFNDETYMILSKENWTRVPADQSPTSPSFNFDDLQRLMIQLFRIN